MEKEKKLSKEEDWRDKHYSHFTHKECEAFPCHENVDEENFNCLFCFCPLYVLGRECGGKFSYNEKGIKDCTGCRLPHIRENYGYIMDKFQDIVDKMKETVQEK